MPIYEFRCAKCGNVQEIIMTRASEEVEMKCKECGCEELDRIMSQVNYAMGDSASSSSQSGCASSPCATSRTCGGGNNCTTLTFPGHTK